MEQDLNKVDETCKLLGFEEYSPMNFVMSMVNTYTMLNSILLINAVDNVYRPSLEKTRDELGRHLLSLGEPIPTTIIGEHLDAGNATTL